jgi:WD40 repeat protein
VPIFRRTSFAAPALVAFGLAAAPARRTGLAVGACPAIVAVPAPHFATRPGRFAGRLLGIWVLLALGLLADRPVRAASSGEAELLSPGASLLLGFGGEVEGAAFAPGGRWLALVSAPGDGTRTAWLWDLEVGQGLRLGTLPTAPQALALGGDGRLLAALLEDSTVALVGPEPRDGCLPARLDGDSLALGEDGRRLAVGRWDGTVWLTDLRTCEVRTLALAPGSAPEPPPADACCDRAGECLLRATALAFAPDSGYLAAGDCAGTVRQWDLATGRSRQLGVDPGAVALLAYSADGQRLVSGTRDGAVRLRDLATGAIRALPELGADVSSVAFDPDGRHLAAACWSGAVTMVDLERSERRPPGDAGAGPSALAFSPDGGQLVAAAPDGTVRHWDLRTGSRRVRFRPPVPVRRVLFSPDGAGLAAQSADGAVVLWDLGDGTGRALGRPGDAAGGLAFGPDGRRLASGGADGVVRVWELASGEARAVGTHVGAVTSVAFGQDGRRVASGGADRRVQLWDLAGTGGRPLAELRDRVRAVALSPDGRWLASRAEDLRLWDLASGEGRLLRRQVSDRVVFSPDGRWLAAGFRLWSLSDPERRLVLGTHGEFADVAFGPDGGSLVSGSPDGAVRLWDLGTGRSRPLVEDLPKVTSVAFAADGRQVAAGLANGVVTVLPVDGAGPTLGFFAQGDCRVGWREAAGGARDFRWSDCPDTLLALTADGRLVPLSGAGRIDALGAGQLRSLVRRAAAPTVPAEPEPCCATTWQGRWRGDWAGPPPPPASLPEVRPPAGSRLELGLEGRISALAFGPDDRLALVAGPRLVLWDLRAGEGRVLAEGDFVSVAWSQDGRWLATAAKDGSLRVREPAGGSERLVGTHDGATAVALDRDGRWLASGGGAAPEDRPVRLWDLRGEGSRAAGEPGNQVGTLRFAAGGRFLAWVELAPEDAPRDSAALRRWDPARGRDREIETWSELGCGAITAVALAPGGRRVVIGSEVGQLARLEPGRSEGTSLDSHAIYPVDDNPLNWPPLTVVAVSPDGRFLASGSSEGTVQLLRLRPREARGRRVLEHTDEVTALAFGADGRWLASGAEDGTVEVLDLRDGSHRRLGLPWDPVRSLAFGPDGRTLAAGSEDRIARLWDVSTGEPRRLGRHEGAVRAVAFAPEGAEVASGGGLGDGVRRWDLAAGTCRVLDVPDEVWSLAYSPDRRWLAVGTRSSVLVWDRAGGGLWRVRDSNAADFSVAFSEGGRTLAWAGDEPGLALLHLTDERGRQVFDASELPLGTTGGDEKRVARAAGRGAFSDVLSLALEPGGRWAAWATGSWPGARVRLWDLKADESRVSSSELQDGSTVAFSPDGRQLATAGDEGVVRLWPLGAGEPRVLARAAAAVHSLAFAPDGGSVAAGLADGSIRQLSLEDRGPVRGRLEVGSCRLSWTETVDGGQDLAWYGCPGALLWHTEEGRLLPLPDAGRVANLTTEQLGDAASRPRP